MDMQANLDLHYSPVDSTTAKDSLHEHEGPDQATVTHRLIQTLTIHLEILQQPKVLCTNCEGPDHT